MTDTTLGPQVSWAANNILRDETWYGTGAPLWFEGPNGVRCQSETQAALGRVRLIKRLKRFGASDIAAQGLVCRLATCAPGQRCCSGACAECGRAFQRWFVNSVARFLAAEKANEPSESSILSIIHDSGRVEPGQLVTSDAHERLWHRVTAALAHVDVKAAVGGLDLSFNEDANEKFLPHWMLHARVHVPATLSLADLRTLRAQFSSDVAIRRPVTYTEFDGDLAGLAYSIKSSFGRRQSYTQEKLTADGFRTCRNTRGRPLRGIEAVELAVFLDQIGLRRRLVLFGAKIVKLRNGAVVIRRASENEPTRPP